MLRTSGSHADFGDSVGFLPGQIFLFFFSSRSPGARVFRIAMGF